MLYMRCGLMIIKHWIRRRKGGGGIIAYSTMTKDEWRLDERLMPFVPPTGCMVVIIKVYTANHDILVCLSFNGTSRDLDICTQGKPVTF